MVHLPLFFSPIGWVVLGAAGYLLYQSGKKAGQKERNENVLSGPSKEIQEREPSERKEV